MTRSQDAIREVFTHLHGSVRPDLETLIASERYRQYVGICRRIPYFLDALGTTYDAHSVVTRTAVFSIWLKAADDLMEERGGTYCQNVLLGKKSAAGTYGYLSETLRALTPSPLSSPEFITTMDNLLQAVGNEGTAKNIREYIAASRNVGQQSALAYVHLLEPAIVSGLDEFRKFFIKLGAVGDIVDGAFDFKEDCNSRNITIPYTIRDHAALYYEASKAVAKVVREYPFLVSFVGKSLLRNSVPRSIYKMIS